MYQLPHFREDRLDVQHELIRAHPLGLLVTSGPNGLMANSIPVTLLAGDGDNGTLRMHLAKANPQWREFEDGCDCLIVFQGAQAYITPTWYATKHETHKVVPTWNYATVHVWGKGQVHDDPAWIRAQIDRLTEDREHLRNTPWAVSDAPEPFVEAQMRGIVGIEVPIQKIEGKWKVSQNQPEPNRLGVQAGLRAEGEHNEAMAVLVAERGGLLG